MKAVIINDSDRNFLGLAANFTCAIDFLIKEKWLDGNNQIWINHRGFLLKEIFPNWQVEIKNWDIEFFNKFFYDDFYLEVVEVYGG